MFVILHYRACSRKCGLTCTISTINRIVNRDLSYDLKLERRRIRFTFLQQHFCYWALQGQKRVRSYSPRALVFAIQGKLRQTSLSQNQQHMLHSHNAEKRGENQYDWSGMAIGSEALWHFCHKWLVLFARRCLPLRAIACYQQHNLLTMWHMR